MIAESPASAEVRYGMPLPRWLELCRRKLLPFFKHVFTGDLKIFPETRLIAEALEEFLAGVQAGKRMRLIIIEPPRSGKSELTTRTFLPWVLGQEPDWHVGVVSYGDDLAWEMSSEARSILMDEPYAEVFGPTYGGDGTQVVEIDPLTKAVKHWKIKGRRGGMRAAGINGSLTGKGYKIVIFDDPTKGRKEADSLDYRNMQWAQYDGTFKPRLEPEGNGIVLMGTAWHIADILSRMQAENDANIDNPLYDHWRVIHVPAQALPGRADPLGREPGQWMGGRRTVEEWEALKANTDPREWAAQYQGLPMPEEGGIFHPYEEFLFGDPPDDDYRGPRYGFSDNSHAKTRSSDHSAILVCQVEPDQTVMEDGVPKRYHTLGILDVYRKRAQYPELKRDAKRMYDEWKLWALVIEDYSAGRALAQEFKRDSKMTIRTYRPDRDKTARANAAKGTFTHWKVRCPKTETFPSGLPVRVFLDELNNFMPDTQNQSDDMVDVFTTALILIAVKNQSANRQIVTREFAFA